MSNQAAACSKGTNQARARKKVHESHREELVLGVMVEGNGVLIRTADALILHQKLQAPFLFRFFPLRLCVFAPLR